MKYSLCFDGGLGDVIIRMFQGGNSYGALSHLKPEDEVDIHIVSHNPFAKELFEWHPKRSQLNIKTYPWREVTHNSQIKLLNGIPKEIYMPDCKDSPILYPSPDDLKVLEQMKSLEPYVVVSATAGGKSRNIHPQCLQDMVPYIQSKGFNVVAVGRSYQRAEPHVYNDENVYAFNKKVISLIDKLSVPGTAELLRNSHSLVACHSAVCLLNWYIYRKPNLIFYPETYARNTFEVGIKDPKTMRMTVEDCFNFGIHYSETIASFNEGFKMSYVDQIL